jgi:UPF0042 nucleotide-binding protein
MRLTVVSGLSGSGKSVALNTLEDEGFYCIDNLPSALIQPLVEQLHAAATPAPGRVAVGIDARSDGADLRAFAALLATLRAYPDVRVEVVFLHTETDALQRRKSATRRKHPLSRGGTPLVEAIAREQEVLAGLRDNADLQIDTTHLHLHGLRALLRERLLPDDPKGLSLLFQSFGFKNGLPLDADFVFDVRCLPNPHWEPRLRDLTGSDPTVIDYLEADPRVERMFTTIRDFLDAWLPDFQADNRAYMSVALGCTGGQHRSVYFAERLARHGRQRFDHVTVRHRELQHSARILPEA